MRELNEGQVYFILGYEDKDFLIPYIQTLIFVETDVLNVEGRDTDVWCFENPRLGKHERSSMCCIAANEMDGVLDLEQLIEALREFQARRSSGDEFRGHGRNRDC